MVSEKKIPAERSYEKEIHLLREQILLMASLVEKMISQAIESFVRRNKKMAKETIDSDHQVNMYEVEIDELCLVILAKRQPAALDLRFITLALKMVTDLERIGDLAVNICKRVLNLSSGDPFKSYNTILRMALIAQSMVRDATIAFVGGDIDKAQSVIDRDDDVDTLSAMIFKELLGIMKKTSNLEQGMHVQFIVKTLERIADHSTNLAEQVIFMVKGKDIRHLGKMEKMK